MDLVLSIDLGGGGISDQPGRLRAPRVSRAGLGLGCACGTTPNPTPPLGESLLVPYVNVLPNVSLSIFHSKNRDLWKTCLDSLMIFVMAHSL